MNPGDDFVCVRCERRQRYEPADVGGGITEAEAVQMGWEKGYSLDGRDIAQPQLPSPPVMGPPGTEATIRLPDPATSPRPDVSTVEVRWLCPFCADHALAFHRFHAPDWFEKDYGRKTEADESSCSCGRPISEHSTIELFANAWWSHFRDLLDWRMSLGDYLWKALLVFVLCHVPVTLRANVFIAATGVGQVMVGTTFLTWGYMMQRKRMVRGRRRRPR